jgi:hypothetical protein
MAAQHAEIGEEIRRTKTLSDDLQARLRAAVEEYKAIGAS